jgi:hypothetical protein
MLVGEVITFSCGLIWLAQALGTAARKALEIGLYRSCWVISLSLRLLPASFRSRGDLSAVTTDDRPNAHRAICQLKHNGRIVCSSESLPFRLR